MTARKDHVRVTVVAPGPGDGPNWQLLVRAPDVRAQRFSSGTTDRDAAEAEAREREARMNALLAPRRGEDPLVMTTYDRHVVFRESDRLTARNTALCYKAARGGLALAFVDVHASQLDANRLEEAQRHLFDVQGLKPITVNLYLQKFAKAWKWAHRKKHPNVGPWPGLPPLPTERTPKRQYTPAELDAVLREAVRYAGGRFVSLLCVLSELGARIGEVCALRGRDVDRETRLVTLTTPKTRLRRRTRTVMVSPEIMALIPERAPGEWVFRAVRDPSKPLSDRTVTSALWTILERVGLGGEPLDLHSFRRYVVRKLHSAGVPVKDAMDFLGHEDYPTHISYMHDLPEPDAQRSLLEKARAHHDPLAALSPGRVAPVPPLKSGRRKEAQTCSGSALKPGVPGQAPRGNGSDLDGSGRVQRQGTVVHLSRSREAQRLGQLLKDLAPANREAVVASWLDADLRVSALVAVREFWPDLVPAEEPKNRGRRRAR